MKGRAMRRWLRLFAFTCFAGGPIGQATGSEPAATAPPLTVGVVPFNNARLLHELHRPLIEHLRRDFGPDVEMVTATGFRAFYEATVQGGYDVAVMPAHLARLAQVDHHFVPLVRYSVDVPGLVVVAANGGIGSLAQLAGKTVAVPDRLALAPITVLTGLEKQGLVAGRDFKLVELSSFNSAVLAIERGEVQAAVTALAPFHQMPPEQRRNLRIVAEMASFPSLIYIVHPRMSASRREKLARSLHRFGKEPAGRAFFAATGFGDFVPVTPAEMRRLDPYVRETRRLLAQKPGT